MTTTDPTAEKPADRSALDSRAKEHAHDAFYLGEDGDGKLHYWSPVHRRVVIFETYADTDPTVLDLPIYDGMTDERIDTLSGYGKFVKRRRGAWETFRQSSLAEMLVEALE